MTTDNVRRYSGDLWEALEKRGTKEALDTARATRTAYAKRVGHVCPLYETPRSGPPHWDGLSDPALKDGIGCPICYPPDGRVR